MKQTASASVVSSDIFTRPKDVMEKAVLLLEKVNDSRLR